VQGASEKSSVDVQLEQFAMAWGMATAESTRTKSLTIRVVGEMETTRFEL
jgi:hypothetical protein